MRPARRRNVSDRPARPDQLGTAYERLLASSAARRNRGIYYTPPAVVDFIVERTLASLFAGRSPREVEEYRVLDPACGCGAFLLGAHRWLYRWYAQQWRRMPTAADRRMIARRHLAGIDIDPQAVALARQAVGQEAGLEPKQLVDRILVGDALLEHDDWFDGRLTAVVANPPYVNIRRLSGARGSGPVNAYRSRYRCATGAFDLYVLFVERAIASLRPGGRLGLIIPNKLATLDYACACRELILSAGTLDHVIDVSTLKLFAEAGVYPQILLWTRQPPAADHAICVERADDHLFAGRPVGARCGGIPTAYVLQSTQRAGRGLMLAGDLPVESRGTTLPLRDVSTIHSGATGFQAAALAARLVDGKHGETISAENACFDFITSGNIDPYSIRLGDVRFMGRRLNRPLLSASDSILTERKRQLYSRHKIVLAGMSQRIEAALDTRGLALGVQVFALTDWRCDPLYLLGLLNSSLLSCLFRLRFAAKKLAGGYYSLSKRQLGQLPIRVIDPANRSERRLHDQIVQTVHQRSTASASLATTLDDQIDDLVLRLYNVGCSELAASSAAA